MADEDQGGEGRWNGRVAGDTEAPLPEPWFIRDLRERRTGNAASPVAPGGAAMPDMAPEPVPEHVLGPQERIDGPGTAYAGPMPGEDAAAASGQRSRAWLYAGAAAVIAIVALVLWLVAQPRTGGADSVVSTTATAPPVAVPSAVPAAAATGLCTDPATFERLRSLIVSDAARRGGDPAALAQAAAGLSLSVAETPDTSGEAGAVACRGWLSLVQPGGAPATAAVSFRALPASGGDARLSIVQGIAPISAALAAAGNAAPHAPDAADNFDDSDSEGQRPPLVAAAPALPPVAVPAPAPAQQPRYSNPSFDCRRVTSWANRAICANDSLAALDRTLASALDDAADNADADTRDDLEDGRREFLARVQRCDDEDCIADVYNDRIDELRRYR